MGNPLSFLTKPRPLPADFPPLRLKSTRLYLRPPHPADFEDWQDIRERNRDHLVPFEPAWHEQSLTRDYFLHRIGLQSRDWHRGIACSFLIFQQDGNELIGGVNTNNIARGSAQFAWLGYWLGRDYQGQGYMHEALHLAMTYSFGAQKLHRLNAATLPHNGRSIKTLRRLGFEEEGFAKAYLQINGEWQDHILFGINEDAFKKHDGIVV